MINKTAILGFRGVGKSSVSTQLKKITGFPLYSLDKIIEENAGESIAMIVEKHGWNYFRDLEMETLKAYVNKSPLIVDCGGGILEGHDGGFSDAKYRMLKDNFFCVYLYLPDAKLLTRLEKIKTNSRRVPLAGEIEATLLKRKPWFEKISDLTINTEDIPVKKIAEMIKKRMADDVQ